MLVSRIREKDAKCSRERERLQRVPTRLILPQETSVAGIFLPYIKPPRLALRRLAFYGNLRYTIYLS